MTARVAVAGSLNVDLVVRTPRIPEPGETIIGSDFHRVPGGKGANQAVAAARLGADVAMVGRVGQDSFAGQLRENMSRMGVDLTHVKEDPDAATGVALIVVDDAGQNSIVVASGANAHFSPEDVEEAEETLANADVLLLQLESPLETVRRAAEIAEAHGVRVILNPAPAQELPRSLLTLVDVLIPNESEAALLTGRSVESEEEARAAAQELLRLGVETVIITLGKRGALLAQDGSAARIPSFEVVAVDTTAAGDAFVGSFAVALAEGKMLREAVRWGNAAGALAATKMGAQPSLPTREALERLLESS
jgi:ribokinase